jgi:hypothetical protein
VQVDNLSKPPAKSQKTQLIRDYILAEAPEHPDGVATMAGRRFGITRQAVNRHVKALIDAGLLRVEGRTQGTTYVALAKKRQETFLVAGLQEHEVWDSLASPVLSDLNENVHGICHYGFTEMLNNVIDHSESERVLIDVARTPKEIEINLHDFGVGIFDKIQLACGLENKRHAIFELTKGKLTTDPERHTGEGIFFTSRMFDSFAILSGRLYLRHVREQNDWLVADEDPSEPVRGGTHVALKIDPHSQHTQNEVFDRYQSEQDDYAFNRTRVLVGLAHQDEALVSRSQAKRILARLDRFKEVVLDFSGVPEIGPSFADEIFRVYRGSHPEVGIVPMTANEAVARMIRRAQSAETEASPSPSFEPDGNGK